MKGRLSEMQIFVNSEKFLVNDVITGQEVINLSGYPKNKNYIIKDEITNQIFEKNDVISLRNNMSLIVQER
jgi:hypothetical protein